MATIKPFRAVRPTAETAKDVAALPYDVYKRDEAKEEIKDKPLSFLRVDRAETTLDDSIGTYDPIVYEQAKKNYEFLKDNKYLIKEDTPSFYLYELIAGDHSQTGLVAATSVKEYLDNTIKKHEATRADKEQDRINHVDALNANTGPIFLTYRNNPEISSLINELKKNEKLFSFISDDGIKHNGWKISDPEVISELISLYENVDNLYIADGHHRCASAVRVSQMRGEDLDDLSKESNTFLSVIFPDNELEILDYNRVVKDLNNLSSEEFLEKLKEAFEIEEVSEAYKPQEKGEFGLYIDGQWYKLKFKIGEVEDPVDNLDVSILYNYVLNPILGIGDPRTDKRIDFVGGIKGLEELERRANSDMKVAFSMYPTQMDELLNIADLELLMPPKSTWFEPKLRSGLFIHELS